MILTRRSVVSALVGANFSTLLTRMLGPVLVTNPGAETAAGATQQPHVLRRSGEAKDWPKLLGHWKLDGDCKDSAGTHHGEGHAIEFVPGHDGRQAGAASFNGIDSLIQVPDDGDFHFGTKEFSVSLWVNLPEDLDSVGGDILSKYDPHRRRGFNLSISGSASGYSGTSDGKNVHFGIDNGINGSWTDCGRPSTTNPLICNVVVYKGNLYSGIASAASPAQACRVYRYAGGTDWVDCGRLGKNDLNVSAYSMIVHKGHLYAGTGTYDWEHARSGIGAPNHVYRYLGGDQWEDCGEVSKGFRTTSLASYKGHLYAGDDYAACYRYEGGREWSSCGRLGTDWKVEQMFNTTTVYQGELYAASSPGIYRFNGKETWDSIGQRPFGTKQVHKLQIYNRHLWAGTWPYGKVLCYEDSGEWSDRGQLGIAVDKFQINEVNDLTVYNGKLYAGVIPKAEVYRYEGGTEWTLLRRLLVDPNYSPEKIFSWSRVPCMGIFQGRLFMGTGTCQGRYYEDMPTEAGRVYAMEAGKNVSYDDDLGAGWKHLAVVRERGSLKMYVNGQLAAKSAAFPDADYELSTKEPLRIGLGEQNTVHGTLDDLRIYGGALTSDQVKALYRKAESA